MHSHETVPGVWRSWPRLALERLVLRPVQGITAVAAGVQQVATPLARAAARVATRELSHQERARIEHGAAQIADGGRTMAVPVLVGALLLLAWCRPIVFCVLAAALLCVAA